MSGKKNIEQLFKERFENFDAVPSEHVWESIEAKLLEKRKKRVIPIWWKLAGVAATLLIGFLTIDHYTEANSFENEVVISPSKLENKQTFGNPDNATIASGQSVDENGAVRPETSPKNNHNSGANASEVDHTTSIVSNSSSSAGRKFSKNGGDLHKKSIGNSPVSISQQLDNSETIAESETDIKSFSNKKKSTATFISPDPVAFSEKPSDATLPNQKRSSDFSNKSDSFHSNLEKVSIETNLKDNAISVNLNAFHKDFIDAEDSLGRVESHKTLAAIINPNNDATIIKISEEGFKKLDSIPAVAVADKVEPNALEELLNEKENNQNAPEPKINRWQVSSNIAPIYLSSVSNGSPINSEFDSNPKQYENNLSYGVGVNYAVGKKFAIRTGVNRFTFGYNTENVVVYAGVASKNLENVNLTPESKNMNVETGTVPVNTTGKPTLALDSEVETAKYNGVLNQEMGYIEVPLEMTYKLINQKFGVNLIGGISTLFLDKNKVSVVSNGLVSEIGEANNLNKIHLSTNVGLGVHYNIYKSIRINVEPMLKYQLNSFSNDSGSFKPYFFGIYSGIGFTF